MEEIESIELKLRKIALVFTIIGVIGLAPAMFGIKIAVIPMFTSMMRGGFPDLLIGLLLVAFIFLGIYLLFNYIKVCFKKAPKMGQIKLWQITVVFNLLLGLLALPLSLFTNFLFDINGILFAILSLSWFVGLSVLARKANHLTIEHQHLTIQLTDINPM